MIIINVIFILGLALPISASNIDDEIIKNLDFYQNMDLLKNEMPFAYNHVNESKSNENEIIINNDSNPKLIDTNPEKK
jgi:hypothetical protein